ncbi:hypothetical protein F4801DRAFT_94566 [Xylaria longipes]|nr:hypothetical protein F4801DRAFT_94566 [Xylaria longipes]
MLMKALKNAQLEAENDKRVATEELNPFRKPSLGEKLERKLASFLMFMIRPTTPIPLPSVLEDGRQMYSIEAAEDRIRSALSELEEVALIYYSEGNETYSIHPVVHNWARIRPRMKLRHQALWADIAGHVLSASVLLPPLDTEDESYHATLLPYIEHVQKYRAEVGAQLKLKSGQFWLSRLVQSLPVNADRIWMYAKFGFVYAQCGDFQKAEPLFTEVTAFLSLYFGSESPRTTAKELQVEVVAGLTKLLGWKHASTLEAMNDLGRTVMEFGRKEDLREAFGWSSKVLKGMREVLGNEHLLTTYAKENLARIFCFIATYGRGRFNAQGENG